jgi:hypothetical protein
LPIHLIGKGILCYFETIKLNRFTYNS